MPTMSRDPEAPSMVPSFLKSLSGFRLLEKNHDFCQQLFLPNPVEMASCSYFCGANWSCRPSRECVTSSLGQKEQLVVWT